MSNRKILLVFILMISGSFVFGQQVVTAERFLEMVSEHYATIRDYEANIAIRSGATEMAGTVSHLSPSFLRLDFTRPMDQVIVFNGETLSVFLPEFRTILNQDINQSRRSGGVGGAGMATAEGLTLLGRNYVPSFVTGLSPEPLYAGSSERVMRLRLTRRTVSEGFREIILSVDPDTMLIRRIEGRTIADVEVRFDFTNIRINQNIPTQRFIFENPPLATMHNNFLFSDLD
jgi:outer membrane lipoprotein-sorting protein